MPEVEPMAKRVEEARRRVPAQRAVLAAVSGIDGSGKGFVAAQLAATLSARGLRVATLNVDGWLNLPQVRFDASDPAQHFYRHAIRFDEMFAQLVEPLRDRRSVDVEVDFAEETATAFRPERYVFRDIDAIVVEGILLLKRELQPRYDVSFWLECSFETALERALARGQEHLSREETVRAYLTTYFPAQEIHLARDDPRRAASAIVVNDARLGTA